MPRKPSSNAVAYLAYMNLPAGGQPKPKGTPPWGPVGPVVRTSTRVPRKTVARHYSPRRRSPWAGPSRQQTLGLPIRRQEGFSPLKVSQTRVSRQGPNCRFFARWEEMAYANRLSYRPGISKARSVLAMAHGGRGGRFIFFIRGAVRRTRAWRGVVAVMGPGRHFVGGSPREDTWPSRRLYRFLLRSRPARDGTRDWRVLTVRRKCAWPDSGGPTSAASAVIPDFSSIRAARARRARAGFGRFSGTPGGDRCRERRASWPSRISIILAVLPQETRRFSRRHQPGGVLSHPVLWHGHRVSSKGWSRSGRLAWCIASTGGFLFGSRQEGTWWSTVNTRRKGPPPGSGGGPPSGKAAADHHQRNSGVARLPARTQPSPSRTRSPPTGRGAPPRDRQTTSPIGG